METQMSNELYYRGSCTYELAVQNQLARLEQSGNYNTTAIQNEMRNLEYGIKTDIRKSTYAIVASQEILAEIYQQGFDSINNTLSFGFKMVASGLNEINSAINEVYNKLDEIHDIVNNPRLTAARELFRRASTNFEKGYYEEALEDCKQAVEKEKTDYISWYLLGQIYLFGAGKFSNVINLTEAEKAFENAAKYIDADIDNNHEAKQLAAQIYYYLGQTKYYLSNDLLINGKTKESNNKLEEAEKNTSRSIHFDDSNLKIRYENAKQLHFLGQDTKALNIIKDLIRKEANFALLSVNDKNLESIWRDIEKAIQTLKFEAIEEIKNELDSKIDELPYDIDDDILSSVNTYKNDCYSILKNMDDITYFEVVTSLKSKLLDGIDKYYYEYKKRKEKIALERQKKDDEIASYEDDPVSFVLKYGYIPEGIRTIKAETFCGMESGTYKHTKCEKLQNIKLPESLEEIGAKAFAFTDLQKIEIPDNVEYIGRSAFLSCDKLEEVTLPASITRINESTFDSCNRLTFINIPKGVTEIGSCAFEYCRRLSEVIIPDSVTEIRHMAFYNCENLKKVTFGSSKIRDGGRIFENCRKLDKDTRKKIKQLGIKNSGCYVATCVYGSYDCPQVWTLRRFRDDILGKTWYGRMFIKTYYAVSPTLVKWFGKTSWFKNMWKPALDKMVRSLQAKSIENTPYEDKMWR